MLLLPLLLPWPSCAHWNWVARMGSPHYHLLHVFRWEKYKLVRCVLHPLTTAATHFHRKSAFSSSHRSGGADRGGGVPVSVRSHSLFWTRTLYKERVCVCVSQLGKPRQTMRCWRKRTENREKNKKEWDGNACALKGSDIALRHVETQHARRNREHTWNLERFGMRGKSEKKRERNRIVSSCSKCSSPINSLISLSLKKKIENASSGNFW